MLTSPYKRNILERDINSKNTKTLINEPFHFWIYLLSMLIPFILLLTLILVTFLILINFRQFVLELFFFFTKKDIMIFVT